MSNTKTVMSQAANTLTTPLNVEDVFSTYLYEGNGSTQTITNGIDLDGEGGLVWIKSRTEGTYGGHALYDTERGATNPNNVLSTSGDAGVSATAAQYTSSPADRDLTSFNSDGFSLGPDNYFTKNTNGEDYASWTFRKAPKFFDVVTWTGDGTTEQAIPHSLGVAPACYVQKELGSTSNWFFYTTVIDGSLDYGYLNTTNAFADSARTAPTSGTFYAGGGMNSSGSTYVAYLFAHNDGDGGFNGGDIIKCGSYTGDGSADGSNTVDLGFEPQWIMIKRAVSSFGDDWVIFDAMRGITTGGNEAILYANSSNAEFEQSRIRLTSTGFALDANESQTNFNGDGYIYIAIRRGTKVPESGTEVFAVDLGDNSGPPEFTSGFPVDFGITKNIGSGNWGASARLTQGSFLKTNTTDAEATGSSYQFDYNDGFFDNTLGSSTLSYMWKRAPNYFDVVAYTGDGTAGRTVSHNLGVAPEMIWVKRRDANRDWAVYAEALGNSQHLHINQTFSSAGTTMWDYTDPTDSVFSVGSSLDNNGSSATYIAYLFASLDGVSKVGSYTGNGSDQIIDCGFTSGARFVLIKRTDDADSWLVFDTERGIVAGNDPYLDLDNTNAEVTSQDKIDPHNSGFIVLDGSGEVNDNGNEYIFYAIA